MEFIYAKELKKQFTCYGHFYELLLPNAQRLKCRSVLEIVDSHIPQKTPSKISLMQPDVVVVMMNPGSSHPKDLHHLDETITYPAPSSEQLPKNLVLTQPDNTQYQIMRVALKKNWHHIRVLNLSDLRDPKSGSFIERVESLQEILGGHLHSIFCPERTQECHYALHRKTRNPILLGWGANEDLLPLAKQCLKQLKEEPICQVPSPSQNPYLNAHPSPMLQSKKLLWLETMLDLLKET
jgi:hypothetical protein